MTTPTFIPLVSLYFKGIRLYLNLRLYVKVSRASSGSQSPTLHNSRYTFHFFVAWHGIVLVDISTLNFYRQQVFQLTPLGNRVHEISTIYFYIAELVLVNSLSDSVSPV